MELPFDSHTIYITLDDSKIYKLNSDYTKVEVPEIKESTREEPTIVLHKKQFDYTKKDLLNKENSFKIDSKTAEFYYQIGFITKEELTNFLES